LITMDNVGELIGVQAALGEQQTAAARAAHVPRTRAADPTS